MTTIGTHNTKRGASGFHPFADVIGWQEVNTDADRAALVAALPGYDHWPVKPLDAPEPARSIPISWDRTKFTLVGVEWTPTTPPRAGVTPRRGIVSVILTSAGGRLAVVNTHFISKRRLSRWRRRMWNEHLAALADVAAADLDADGSEVVVVGDMNRHQWLTLPGLTHASVPLERVPYDQIHGPAGLTAVRGPAWGSDHHSWTAQLTEENPMARVQIFPGANHTAQWFADNFPGSRFDANCGVLHSTEGTSWPGYEGGASAPTLTAKPDIPNKRLVWRQHFPIDMSSRALRNLSGGVETNTAGAVQVELIGTTDPKHRRSWNGDGRLLAGRDYIYWPEAPDWALAGVAKFMRWCNTEHGIKLQGPTLWLPYPESFGATRARMSFDQWRGFFGWCAHQHVPENTHGDVKLDFARLLELAKPSAATGPTRVTRVRAALLAVLNSPDAKSIPERRKFVRGLLALIRTTTNRLPNR